MSTPTDVVSRNTTEQWHPTTTHNRNRQILISHRDCAIAKGCTYNILQTTPSAHPDCRNKGAVIYDKITKREQ